MAVFSKDKRTSLSMSRVSQCRRKVLYGVDQVLAESPLTEGGHVPQRVGRNLGRD